MHQIISSEDGSHTILSEQFGVTYHSKYGAIQETETVFLNAGLQYQIDQNLENIHILEMGFGTGLNAIMTYVKCENQPLKIDYHTIEAYPISMEMAQTLNYPEILNLDDAQTNAFHSMHSVESSHKISLDNDFDFEKSIAKLQDLELPSDQYDIIYYDAFAPTSQEELWTEEMMSKLYKATRKGGVLVTYCAKGAFKRALKSAGYTVEGLPGPKGKREMTRALKG